MRHSQPDWFIGALSVVSWMQARRWSILGAMLLATASFATWRVAVAQDEGPLAARFRQLDADNDRALTPDELTRPEIFARLDTNRDGRIPFDEARKAVLDGALHDAPPPPADPNKPAAAPVRQGPKLLSPGEHGIGRLAPDATFHDLSGEPHRLSEFAKKQAVVVAMTSVSCPLSKKYLPTLVELAKSLSERDVAFIVANPVATDDAEAMRAAQQLFGDAAIYVQDADGALAAAVGARTTTDAVLLDSARTVVYHGAVDDQYGFGYATDAPRFRYLSDAVNALLAGRSPLVAATEAPGCALDRSAAPVASARQTTYYGQVARLMERHCVECHRAGGVGPFPLDAYDDVVAHAPMIRQVVERGVMPPWFAAPAEQDHPSPWINDRSLSAGEKQELLAWLAGDKQPGNPADAPRPRAYPAGWVIGQPDAIFAFSEPVQVKATGTMPYQNVVVETNLPEDRWVQAIEIKPGDRSVVHHALVFVLAGDEKSENDVDDRDPAAEERSGYWGIYVPGNSTLVYPDGYAKRLPKNARLRFQMHYTPNGTATEDRTEIGLIFAKQPPQHEVRVAGIVNARISIPPGAANHKEVARLRLPFDVQVLALLPHMHLRGKAARYDIGKLDGSSATLLDIPRYDFNWQLLYRLAEPLPLARGDTISFTAWYDNSEANPANPDPTRTVRWGPQTYDEMHLGYVEYIVPGHKPGEPLSSAAPSADPGRPAGARGGAPSFAALDVNGDGRLTLDEVNERLPDRPAALAAIFRRLDSDANDQLDRAEFSKFSDRRGSRD